MGQNSLCALLIQADMLCLKALTIWIFTESEKRWYTPPDPRVMYQTSKLLRPQQKTWRACVHTDQVKYSFTTEKKQAQQTTAYAKASNVEELPTEKEYV